MPTQQFFSYIMVRTSCEWDDDEVCFVLDQHAELDFYSASSLKQQSADKHVAPLGHIILIPNQPVFVLFLNAGCLA
jgi:predicted alpha/beta hydrolase